MSIGNVSSALAGAPRPVQQVAQQGHQHAHKVENKPSEASATPNTAPAGVASKLLSTTA